ncbi:MAG: AAA family ATPase, partial [Marinosulfonomonas sp.]|nr:AAA family ATPase [Marinosulfonomonas sp.]
MLRSLDIRDLLIIDHLQLEFQPGLNVLTGETGAGKSILLDSLGFVLGWRGRAELVRKGAAQGEVLAVFDLDENHPARGVLADAGLPVDDELILRRVNTSDGRKTAWVNDRRVSGEVLRQLSELLVELHGQQDDRGLLDVRAHRRLLDDFSGLGRDVDAARKAWRDVHAARKALKDAQTSLDAVRQEEDFLRHAVAELDGLDPQPGEEGALDEKRRLMQAAERIGDDIAKALVALGSDGAEGNLADALRWLEDVAGKAEGQLDEPLAAIARAANELAIAEQGVQSAVAAMSFDAHDLEQAEERLFAIRALARKHDVAADDLGEFGAALRAKLAAL